MKAAIKNTSRALQGVHTTDGLKFIEPGSTRTLDVADGYVDRVKALPFLDAKWHGETEEKEPELEPLDRDDLKKQADELGLDYARNISNVKLKELIDAKLAS
jgi:hypothetical protein